MIDGMLIEKYIQKLKLISQNQFKRKDYEKSIKSLKAAANILYTFNQRYTDSEIENQITEIRKCILSNSNSINVKKDVVFFYDGFGLDLRGWAASYVRALTKLGYYIIYMCPSNSKIPHILGEMNSNTSEVIYLCGSNIEKAKTIDSVFKNYKPGTAFFYTYPDDISAAIAFENNPCTTRIQIDLTDHAFWIGVNAFDYILESREMGASIAVHHRFIGADKIIKYDCTPYIIRDKCNITLPFDIEKEKYIFTGGSLYKTLGDRELLYYNTIRYILKKYTNIKFLYAGEGDSSEIEKLIAEYPDRVFLVNERPDFFELIKNCILYINSYPMFGGLMMRFAALAGKVPITLKHGNDSDGLLINQELLGIEFDNYDDFISEIDHLLTDSEYRSKKERLLNNSVYNEEMFAEELDLVIKNHKSKSSFESIREFDTIEFRKEYLRRNSIHTLYKLFASKSSISLVKYFPKEFFMGCFFKLKGRLLK